MKHPHPDRLAEVYRRDGDRLVWVGYTADPPPGATWGEEILGSRQEPERARLADLKRAFEVRSTRGGRIWWIEPATPVSSAQGKAYFR
jgi:hypothetical protein